MRGNPHAAFDVAGAGYVAGSRCCDTRITERARNREHKLRPTPARQSSTLPKRLTQEPARRVIGMAAADGTVRANQFQQTCRGNGDGKHAKLTSSNTGSPSGDRSSGQPATRERQAGPYGVTERLVVLKKPSNVGGGKGPQLKTNARSHKGHGD